MNGGDARAGVLELRTPLARIQLLTSQLAREATTPNARHLSQRIEEAVMALDARIGGLAAALRPAVAGETDAAPILADLHARLAPVLRARGVELEAPATQAAPLPLDAGRLHQAGIALLRAGALRAGEGGRLQLEPDPGSLPPSLAVRVTPSSAGQLAAGDAATDQALQQAGWELVEEACDPGVRLRLRFGDTA